MYQTLAHMEQEFNKVNPIVSKQSLDYLKCKRSEVLNFDEMKIKEKIVFNSHTNEIIGLEEVACTTDVIATELKTMLSDYNIPSSNDDRGRQKPTVAKYILLFMFILWDYESNLMKTVVAGFSIGSSSGEGLRNTIRFVIRALASRQFIVNQVTCDGATDNVSVMK